MAMALRLPLPHAVLSACITTFYSHVYSLSPYPYGCIRLRRQICEQVEVSSTFIEVGLAVTGLCLSHQFCNISVGVSRLAM